MNHPIDVHLTRHVTITSSWEPSNLATSGFDKQMNACFVIHRFQQDWNFVLFVEEPVAPSCDCDCDCDQAIRSTSWDAQRSHTHSYNRLGRRSWFYIAPTALLPLAGTIVVFHLLCVCPVLILLLLLLLP